MIKCRFFMPFVLVLLVLVLLLAPLPSVQAEDGPEPLCFPETNQCLEGIFKLYWENYGGLMRFGYPLAPADLEYSVDTNRVVLAQWLERVRMESHPDNPAPYQILFGRLGDERLRQLGIDWQTLPRENGPRAGCLWFPETGHNVCDQERGNGFKTYWQTHGLRGAGLTTYQGSLALFGFPLTEARVETNSSGDTVLMQWFERARFEWHPNNPRNYKVLLGHLGREVESNRINNTKAQGDVLAINHTEGVIRLGELHYAGIDTIVVNPTTIITRQSDGQPITLQDIHPSGGPYANSDRIWALGRMGDNTQLQAQYVVVLTQ